MIFSPLLLWRIGQVLLALMWLSTAFLYFLTSNSSFIWHIFLYTLAINIVGLALHYLASPRLQSSASSWLLFYLLVWLGFISLTGGAANPLISILIPIIAMASLLLPSKQAWGITTLGVVGYSVLWFVFCPIPLKYTISGTQLHLTSMWATFSLVAFFITSILLRLKKMNSHFQQQLHAAQEKQVRDNWLISVGTIAASAAHDLGTPLNTMSLLVHDLLESYPADPLLTDDLKLLKHQLDRCQKGLGSFSEHAKQLNTPQQSSLKEWLQKLVAQWRNIHPATELILDIHDAPDCLTHFDVSVANSLTNLLDNAVRSRATHINLKVFVRQTELWLELTDNGMGIDDEALTAFAFGQPVQSESGMGIGLLLTRGTFERLGGSMRIYHRLPKGTRVLIILPMRSI